MSLFRTVGESIQDAMKASIQEAIPDATEIAIDNSHGGHYAIRVVAASFEGKSLVAKQRMVYRAITPFMSPPDAPVHAIDKLETIVP